MLSLPAGAYDENFERGSLTFPFDYHYINKHHPRFIMPFHYHIDHELIRILKGGLSITLNERHYYLKEGDYLFISDGVVHGGHPDSINDVYECVVFNLSFDVLLLFHRSDSIASVIPALKQSRFSSFQ